MIFTKLFYEKHGRNKGRKRIRQCLNLSSHMPDTSVRFFLIKWK